MFKELLQSCTQSRAIAAFLFLGVLVILAQFGYRIPHAELGGLAFCLGELTITEEVKKAVDQIGTTFEEFKKANDEKLAQIEQKGYASADILEKVDKTNAAISELQAQLKEVEKKQNRPNLRGDLHSDAADKREYKKAMDAYLRKGDESLLHALETKAYNSGSNVDGGFLVPEEMAASIDRVVTTVSAVGKLAQTINISTQSYSKFVKTAGMSATRPGDGNTNGESDNAKYAKLIFTPSVAEIEPHVFNEHLEDQAYDLETDISLEAEIGFAELAAFEFIRGSGNESARGITQYDTVANSSYAWGKLGYIKTGVSGDLAATSPGDNFIDLQHSLKAQYRAGAAFVMSDQTLAKVRQIKDGSGAYYLWQPDASAGFGGRLLGSPVEIDDNMPNFAANSFSVAYGNFQRGYLVVNRTDIVLIRDAITTKGRTKFNFRRRFTGGVQNFEAIKLLKLGTS